MKLTVTVCFGKSEATFDIAVGDGQKSVKWLATVSAQRFSARAPHGRLRTREPLMAQPQHSAYMPSSVTTEDTSFFHPEALLAEVMHDAQHVTVTLAPKIPVDEIGHTMLSRWAIIAFATSDAQRALRETALKEEYVIQEEQRREREEREAAARLAEQRFKATEMREVIKQQLHSPQKIEEALMEDWYNMNRRSMIDNWVRSPVEQAKVRTMFEENYVQLSELFKTYGAAGAAMGTTHEMEYNEFSQFCTDVKIFDDVKNAQEMMTAAYGRANCYTEAGEGRESTSLSLDRPGFFNAMIQIAIMKYTDDGTEQKAGSRGGGRRSRHRSTRAGQNMVTDVPASDHVRRMLSEYVMPLVSKRLVGAMVKSALNSDEVLAMFYDNHDNLYKMFDKYSDQTIEGDEAGALTEGMMTGPEFHNLIEDAGLIGSSGTEINDELTLREVRQAFAAAQAESAFGAEEKTLVNEAALSHLQLMSYPEFIEGIARLGAMKWEEKSIALFEKIELAVNAICMKLHN